MNVVRTPPGGGRARAATALLLAVSLAACAPDEAAEETAQEAAVSLEELDAVLAELGGKPTADLTRGQRWRLISSVGAGLPPSNFEAESLPDAGSRGAGLIEAYCTRCHWLPTPQMHAAREWPLLLRRMQMRAETLADRLGGPLTEGLMGEYVLAGMATVAVPSEENLKVILEYLQAYALPVAQEGELGETEEDAFYRQRCSACHEVPSPAAHTASEWPAVVGRMRANAALMDVVPLDEEDTARINAYLQSRS
ncbi:MAG: hypothetical protein KAJ67_07295 [Gemmatimonadetes bacterium]|nr:hypothetical protein [Gemmatimonadota bacterium]